MTKTEKAIFFFVICLMIFMYGVGFDVGKNSKERSDIYSLTDPITNCQYLENSTRSAITPRLRPNGTQMCEVNHE